jgi:hypothetical protein
VCIYEYTYAYIYINIIIIYNIQYSDMLSTQQHDYQSCLCHTHARPSTLPLSHASLSPSTLRVARQPEPAPPPTQAPPVLEQRDRRLAPPRRPASQARRAAAASHPIRQPSCRFPAAVHPLPVVAAAAPPAERPRNGASTGATNRMPWPWSPLCPGHGPHCRESGRC